MRPGRVFAAVFLLAILVQIPVTLEYRADPYRRSLVSDALSYDEWASKIATRGLGEEPTFHQSPLYPLALSVLYRVVEPPHRMGWTIAVQVLVTSLAIALLVPLGRAAFGCAHAGFGGAMVALLHGPFVFYSLKLLPVPLALATQAGALLALLAARERASAASKLGAGVLLGIATMARSEMLLFVPFAAAAVAFPGFPADRGRRVRAACALLIGWGAGVAPATLHNVARGDLVLVASSGGENLYVGNRRGAEGDHAALDPRAGDLFSQRILAREVAEASAGRPLGAAEVSRHWRDKAVEEILADPAGWLHLEGRKLARVLHPGDPTDIYSFPLERSRYLASLRLLPLSAWGVLCLGSIGWVLSLRPTARRRAWPAAAFVATQLATLLVFFVNSRLRLPLLFFLAPFGGFAIAVGVRAWREGRRRLLVAVAGGLTLALAAAGSLLTEARPRDSVRLASVLSTQGRFDDGLEVLEPVLADVPYGIALDQAGWLHQRKGDLPSARDRYRQALAVELPAGRVVQVRTRLAQVLEALGDERGAAEEHDRAAADVWANAGTFYERGMFRRRRGDPQGAIRDFQEAVRLDPAWGSPRAALAEVAPR